jgi:hypothetical protein
MIVKGNVQLAMPISHELKWQSETEQTWTKLRLDISDIIWNQIKRKIKIAAKYNSIENFNYKDTLNVFPRQVMSTG